MGMMKLKRFIFQVAVVSTAVLQPQSYADELGKFAQDADAAATDAALTEAALRQQIQDLTVMHILQRRIKFRMPTTIPSISS